jgi:hypothetical protein
LQSPNTRQVLDFRGSKSALAHAFRQSAAIRSVFRRIGDAPLRNKARFETNIRPTPAAKRNHSHNRTGGNRRNKTPVPDRQREGGGHWPFAGLRKQAIAPRPPAVAGIADNIAPAHYYYRHHRYWHHDGYDLWDYYPC